MNARRTTTATKKHASNGTARTASWRLSTRAWGAAAATSTWASSTASRATVIAAARTVELVQSQLATATGRAVIRASTPVARDRGERLRRPGADHLPGQGPWQ